MQLADLGVTYGEDKEVGLTVPNPTGADLSASTAKLWVTNSGGELIVNAATPAGSGTTTRVFPYLAKTGSTGPDVLKTIEPFHFKWEVTFGTDVSIYEYTLHVYPTSDHSPYHNAADWARSRLLKTETDLTDNDLYNDIRSVIDLLTFIYPCIGVYPDDYLVGGAKNPYSTADTADKRALDEAIGLLVAARRYALQTSTGTGKIKSRTEGDTRYDFDVGTSSKTKDSERTLWANEAARALSRVACIAEIRAATPVFSLFSVVTPSRDVETSLSRIYADMLTILKS